jgi:hypothetical protein
MLILADGEIEAKPDFLVHRENYETPQADPRSTRAKIPTTTK